MLKASSSTFFDRDEALVKDLAKYYALGHERGLLLKTGVFVTEKEHSHDLSVKSIDRLSETKVKLTIEFGGDTMEKHEKMMLTRYIQSAKIPGFRPGKAPAQLIKQKFKEEIKRDIVSHLLEAGLNEALQQTKLSPVSRPKVEFNEIVDGKPFAFSAEFEVEPEIKLKAYKGISLKKQITEPTEEDIKETFNNLRERMATLEPSTAEKAEKGSFAVVEVGFVLKDNPNKKEESKSYTVELGIERVLPNVEKALMEMKAGETREVEETFPAEYGDATVAGKTANFTVKLIELKNKILPELNDAFAAQLKEGATIESLTGEIRENIKQSKGEESKKAQRQEIVDHLVVENTFEVPASLAEEQTTALLEWMKEDFKKRNIKMPPPKADEMGLIKKRAENMVKSTLILKAIAQKERIQLDSNRMQARVEMIATQLAKTVPEAQKFLNEKGITQRLRDEILTDQLFEFLVTHAKMEK
ncbi:MAG: trigger factor [Proteobacteria bacterium]|nr:trigger factor [Pseudomonadota bacterium]